MKTRKDDVFMKKYVCMILAVVMIAATLAACGSNDTKKVATDGSTSMKL